MILENTRQHLKDDMMVLGMILGGVVSRVYRIPLFDTILLGGLLGTTIFVVNYQILEPFGWHYRFRENI